MERCLAVRAYEHDMGLNSPSMTLVDVIPVLTAIIVSGSLVGICLGLLILIVGR